MTRVLLRSSSHRAIVAAADELATNIVLLKPENARLRETIRATAEKLRLVLAAADTSMLKKCAEDVAGEFWALVQSWTE
ncbi:hypothetical protein HDU98_005667, partial [Podochytrium sp. JEL0797]